eukprot:2202373-Rhodomonas_salina.2
MSGSTIRQLSTTRRIARHPTQYRTALRGGLVHGVVVVHIRRVDPRPRPACPHPHPHHHHRSSPIATQSQAAARFAALLCGVQRGRTRGAHGVERVCGGRRAPVSSMLYLSATTSTAAETRERY